MQLDLTVTQVIQFISPTVNAGNKSELVGVVDSVGEALSHEFEQILSCCDVCLDLPSFMRCKDACSLSKDDPQVSPVIDDGIPHFGLGV